LTCLTTPDIEDVIERRFHFSISFFCGRILLIRWGRIIEFPLHMGIRKTFIINSFAIDLYIQNKRALIDVIKIYIRRRGKFRRFSFCLVINFTVIRYNIYIEKYFSHLTLLSRRLNATCLHGSFLFCNITGKLYQAFIDNSERSESYVFSDIFSRSNIYLPVQ